jgi:hypothetical protein
VPALSCSIGPHKRLDKPIGRRRVKQAVAIAVGEMVQERHMSTEEVCGVVQNVHGEDLRGLDAVLREGPGFIVPVCHMQTER